MAIRKVELAKASVEDLRLIANTVLNLAGVDADATAAVLRSKIMAASDALVFDVPVAETKRAAQPHVVESYGKGSAAQKYVDGQPVLTDANGKVWIQLHESEDDPENLVPVAVNGRNMLIPRGVPCAIPVPYFEVLKHSIRKVAIQGKDQQIIGWRDVPAYPFSVLQPPRDVAA